MTFQIEISFPLCASINPAAFDPPTVAEMSILIENCIPVFQCHHDIQEDKDTA